MLVTGLAEQVPRPKRIDTLTLPMASFGDPLIAGVRLLRDLETGQQRSRAIDWARLK